MGGNMRHANKGPDRSKSECNSCNTEFTHGKYTRRKYCDECRDDEENPDNIETNVRITDDSELKVTVEVKNNNDVPFKIPSQDVDEDLIGVLGYIRVVSENYEFEDVIIGKFDYGYTKVRRESTRNWEFVFDGNKFEQENKPTVKYEGVIGEEFRDRIRMVSGDINVGDEIGVQFIPVEDNNDILGKSVDSTIKS